MDELTIEEKARYYDRAIEKAKDAFNDGTISSNTIAYLQDLFPELKESEDERIRKFLHHTFTVQYLAKDKLGKWHGEPVSNILAWLEKQGEKELDPRYIILDKLIEADDIYQMSVNYAMVEEAKNKAIEALSKLEISKLFGLEKQGEKKPWSEEDERKLNKIIDIFEEIKVGSKSVYCGDALELQNWLKSLSPQNRWKPSEEQIKVLHDVAAYIDNSIYPNQKDILSNLYLQLKELKWMGL